MTCEIVAQGDFTIRVRDGGSFVHTIAMWGSASYTNGGRTLADHRLPDGSFAPYAPTRTEDNASTLTFTGRPVGLGGVNTAIMTMSNAITHGAAATYGVRFLLFRPGAIKGAYHTVTWVAGATAGDTDDNADAAFVAWAAAQSPAIAAVVAHAVAGTVTVVFPVGFSVKISDDEIGTGTLAATVAATGGTASAEMQLCDILNQSGQFNNLVSTTGTGACASAETTLTWEIEANGKVYTFPIATATGSANITPERLETPITVTSRSPFVLVSDAA